MLRLLAPTLLLTPLAMPTSLPALQEVTGSATFRERMAVPPGAVFEATLQDVSRADAPAQVVSRLTMHGVGNPPYAFVLPYRPEQLSAGHRYAVRTTLKAGGELLFTSDTHVPALQAGNDPLRIVMVRAPAGAKAEAGHDHAAMHQDTGGLTGVHWTLVELGGQPVTRPEGAKHEPHLMFEPGAGRYHGTGGCNRVSGSYQLEGTALTLGPAAATMMMCPPPVMAVEDPMLKMLGTVKGAVRQDDTLSLTDASGTVVARFRAKAMDHGAGGHSGHGGH